MSSKNFQCKLSLMTGNYKMQSIFYSIQMTERTNYKIFFVINAPNLRTIGSCVFCAPLDRHIGRDINRQSTDVSVDISAECRPICRLTYRSSVGQYVDRDVSLDISADILVEHRSICRLTLHRYVDRYVDREWSSDCWPTCRSIGYRHSTNTSLLLAYW